MPWWGWFLSGLGILVLLAVGWFGLFVWLMSKGDTE